MKSRMLRFSADHRADEHAASRAAWRRAARRRPTGISRRPASCDPSAAGSATARRNSSTSADDFGSCSIRCTCACRAPRIVEPLLLRPAGTAPRPACCSRGNTTAATPARSRSACVTSHRRTVHCALVARPQPLHRAAAWISSRFGTGNSATPAPPRSPARIACSTESLLAHLVRRASTSRCTSSGVAGRR